MGLAGLHGAGVVGHRRLLPQRRFRWSTSSSRRCSGVAVAFGITALTIGYLNTNTAFLGSIILGNGINFGIILLARYREAAHARPGRRPTDARRWPSRSPTTRPTLAAALAAGIAYASLALDSGSAASGSSAESAASAWCCAGCRPTATARRSSAFGSGYASGQPAQRAAASSGSRHGPSPMLCCDGAIYYSESSRRSPWSRPGSWPRWCRSPFEYDFSKLRNQHSRKHGAGDLYVRVGRIFSAGPRARRRSRCSPPPQDAALFDQALLEKDCADGLTRAHSAPRRIRRPSPPSAPDGWRRASRPADCSRRSATAYDYLPKDQDAKLAVIADIRRRLDRSGARSALRRGAKEDRGLDAARGSAHSSGSADLPEAIARRFRELDGTVGPGGPHLPDSGLGQLGRPQSDPALRRDRRTSSCRTAHVASRRRAHSSLFAAMLRSIAHDGPIATVAALSGSRSWSLLLFRNARSIVPGAAVAPGRRDLDGGRRRGVAPQAQLPQLRGPAHHPRHRRRLRGQHLRAPGRRATRSDTRAPSPRPAAPWPCAPRPPSSATARCSSPRTARCGRSASSPILGEVGCLLAALLLVPALSRRHRAQRAAEAQPSTRAATGCECRNLPSGDYHPPAFTGRQRSNPASVSLAGRLH